MTTVNVRVKALRPIISLLGPAFVASIAYVDPGNVAANVAAGANYGFLLVWVVVAANLMACLVQYLSAKLGIVACLTLPEAVGARLSKPARIAYWGQAEIVAMATDLAEVIGGAIALFLLFGLPPLAGGAITGVVSMAMLAVKDREGQRTFEHMVMGLLAVIAVGFCASLAIAPPDAGEVAEGLLPRFHGSGSVLIAAAMLGATVMPHAVYLHSGLAKDRHGAVEPAQRGRLLRATRWDVGFAMALAGTVNLAMLLVAAQNLTGVTGVDSIEGAHAAVAERVGPFAALCLAIGLLASGLASSSVGAYAGSMIMHGLLGAKIPLLARRLATLVPALVIIALGADLSEALVLSQVVLSFGIPFALIPLVRLTSDPAVMGEAANAKPTRALGWLVAGLITALNILLIWLTAKS
ncbi:Mn2+/Fe2+ transporter, NRAMP family [Segniliparus rotundus DSM 44985]|uniref:Mn2+/Fe2+ transporter, NRAMP family n=1 Tax=Segniliparus rotundus (strain ATCC BAA-972 / CDC 1076 / CIP 108378 / DSM 44985 / JCM 13578) TaxID=640132 RepID=D6Z944_SEGRD|nr:Nramp family divalent metal transporter [Segniliparus rotundus]ADG98474.1 Mn2+/Fe2+ transporter, NRAMP family [Segniliparus rotundus DSM 44985]